MFTRIVILFYCMAPQADDLVKYLEHITHLLDSDQIDEEEQKTVLDNVREEIKGNEQHLARSPEGSKIFETLLSHYDPEPLIELFVILIQSGVDLAFHVFGSRVLEKLLCILKQKILSRNSKEENAVENGEKLLISLKEMKQLFQGDAKQVGGGEKEKASGWGWVELMSDSKASHVIREFIECLVDTTDKSTLTTKQQKKIPVHSVISLQKQLWEVFLSIVDDILHPLRSVKRSSAAPIACRISRMLF